MIGGSAQPANCKEWGDDTQTKALDPEQPIREATIQLWSRGLYAVVAIVVLLRAPNPCLDADHFRVGSSRLLQASS